MKRLISVILIVLLLCGCGAGASTSEPSEEETTQPVPSGLYNPNSKAEEQSGGAVRAYPLGSNLYVAMHTIGNKLLLVADNGELLLLTGDVGEKIATAVTGTEIYGDSLGFCAAQTGVGYYVAETREVVLLNPNLQETGRYTLPETIQGTPAISMNNNEVYYSTGHEVCALDLQTRIERKVRMQESATLALHGCYFEGKVLSVQITDAQGKQSFLYISSETGQILSEDQHVISIKTEGDLYYVDRLDGYVHQRILGTTSKTPLSVQYLSGEVLTGQVLSARLFDGTYDYATAVLKHNGILSYKMEEKGAAFAFHDLATGVTTAQMILPQVEAPVAMTADNRYVWVIAAHAGTNKQVLYRWDVSMSSAEEDLIALSPLYTAENPDADGLKLQQEHVDWYNEKYGIRIAIWQDAVKQTGQYRAVAEHQPSVISDVLSRLEPAYTLFPENFLRKTVENGWIRICVVRSIEGGRSWAQFWHDGDCYILLTPEGDVVNSFLQAVSFSVDTHVLGNSRDFDNWAELNPPDFAYDYSYDLYENREDLSLTEGEKRAFIDSLSMTYPHEDRCRVFYYAITAGNEDVFASKFMQNKLQKLCEGIREAYGLEKKEDSYVWEQYLTQEMDYSYT